MAAVIHIAALYAAVSGLARKAVDVIRGPIEAVLIEEEQPVLDEREPPPPILQRVPLPVFPPPVVDILQQGGGREITQASPDAPLVRNVPRPAPVRVAPQADPRRPNLQPDYPATSQRLGEEGTVILNLLVGTDGRVGDAVVGNSSGFSRLDDAALKEARRSYRFIPATENGTPIETWHKIKVTFRMIDAR